MHGKYYILILAIGYWLLAIGLAGCRGDEIVVPSEYELLPIAVRQEPSSLMTFGFLSP